MYDMYFSEERRRSGQNGARPFGLRAQMTPCSVTRHSFGFTKRHSSCLAWRHLGRQRSGLTRLGGS